MNDFIKEISEKLNIPEWKIKNTVDLLEEGKTIPFISRYRKERTGELNEIQIRDIFDNLEYLKKLSARKEEVLKNIGEKGKLTEELKKEIENAKTLQVVEDLYLPFKTRKKTRADKAIENGLEPLSVFLKTSGKRDDGFLNSFISAEKELASLEEVLGGAKDIIAQEISQNVKVRDFLRNVLKRYGIMETSKTDKEDEREVYRDYYEFSQEITRLVPHRVMAIFRGEKEKKINCRLTLNRDVEQKMISLVGFNKSLAYYDYIVEALEDSYTRLLFPSIEREVRNELKEDAEERAIKVFSKNLRELLLTPPLGQKVVMGIDPGYRTGCKVAVVDSKGEMVYYDTIYPTPPKNDVIGASSKLTGIIKKLKVEIISIGNGTGSRETEQFVADMIKDNELNCKYLITSESGASVYSASKVAIEEFPQYDVTTRGAISIARRVQDPLAEYVKIPPFSIGVGMYQHDLPKTELNDSLDREVESVVNLVGVNLNTASEHLLKHISGLNSKTAKNIVLERNEKGFFEKRKDLLKVKGLGKKAFEQAAGFCRIINGKNPLDGTTIHPESYEIALDILKTINFDPSQIFVHREELKEKLKSFDPGNFSKKEEFNSITVNDIYNILQKPGLDPREELEKPILRSDVLSMEDLKEGMELEGTVRNVVDFGAFVDIGVKQDGLVHRSKMGNRRGDPLNVFSIGQIIKVKILSVDVDRKRISLEFIGSD